MIAGILETVHFGETGLEEFNVPDHANHHGKHTPDMVTSRPVHTFAGPFPWWAQAP